MQNFVKSRQLQKGQLNKGQLAQLARLPTGKPFEVPADTGRQTALPQQASSRPKVPKGTEQAHDDSVYSDSEITTSGHGAPDSQVRQTYPTETLSHLNRSLQNLQAHSTYDQSPRSKDGDFEHIAGGTHQFEIARGKSEYDVQRLRHGPSRSLQSYPTTTSGFVSEAQSQSSRQDTLTIDVERQREPADEASTLAARGPLRASSRSRVAQSHPAENPRDSQRTPVRSTAHETSRPATSMSAPSQREPRSMSEPGADLDDNRHAQDRATSADVPLISRDQQHPLTDFTGDDLPIRSSGLGQYEEEVDDMDYDLEELRAAKFDALQRESFDVDPRKRPRSRQSSSISLSERLLQLVATNEAEQMQHLDTMTLDEWKATGDWIAEQDNKLRHDLERNRESRRSTAKQFEAEIAMRHEGVCKMQGIISGKLAEMKRNGGMVLGR
ncbi:MAG: hypothetical protein M1828_006769 [Chrysothrix sp. TS-e1954]|nr:MAG: hypothetical protein M1828_006769 [Chrysothrix sp. TS-e1954]